MTGFKKKLTLLLLSVVSAAALCFGLALSGDAAFAAGATLDKAEYFNVEGGTFTGLTEAGYKAVGQNSFSIVLPATVTAIGDGNARPSGDPVAPTANTLFSSGNYDVTRFLTGVTFADASKVTSIGYRSFVNCTVLTGIDLSATGVTTAFGDDAFRGCTALTSAKLPANATKVPANAFLDCSKLVTAELGGSVRVIGASAFENCEKLSSFPASAALETIEANSFKKCSSLTSVTVPATVTSIGEYAFRESGLTEVNLPDSSSFTSLSKGLFADCYNLAKVNAAAGSTFNIPGAVTVIGASAFSNCGALTEITIPAAVTTIGLNAFYGLSKVTTINYCATNATSISPAPFSMSEEGYKSSDVTVNVKGVTVIPKDLFKGHKSVSKVVFESVNIESEANVGMSAFADCTALKEVAFKNCSIKIINDEAFSGCTALHTVNGVESIGLETIKPKAFYNCRSLNSIVLGEQLNSIGSSAFAGCTRLIEVQNLSSHITLHLDDPLTENGGVATYAKYIRGKDDPTRLKTVDDKFTFYADTTPSATDIWLLGYKGDETTVTLPDKYNNHTYNIYDSAFIGNTKMQSLYIPELAGVTHIGKYAFEGCTALNEVNLPKGLLDVGENLFAGCTSLRLVNFNNNDKLEVISDNMFNGCVSLSLVTLPKNTRVIGANAFNGCQNLSNVELPETLTKIGGSAFAGCTALTVADIPDKVTTVDTGAFEGCTNLEFVYLPAGDKVYNAVKYQAITYGDRVFNNCSPNLLLISNDKERFAADSSRAKLRACFKSTAGEETEEEKAKINAKFTYLVKLVLVYNDGCADGVHEVNKLFGKEGDYSQYSSGYWAQTGHMPLQDCPEAPQKYITSEWFSDQAYQNNVNLDALTGELKKSGVSEITLYARYFDHPKLAAPNNVTYDASSTDYKINDIITKIFKEDGHAISAERAAQLTANFSFSVISHTFADGTEDTGWSWWGADSSITEAGTYVVSVTLPTEGQYGSWEKPKNITFTIDPGEVDITDLLLWKPENGSLAPVIPDEGDPTPVELYFYGSETPYIDKLIEGTDSEGKPVHKKPSKTLRVINSYTVASGTPIELKLKWKDGVIEYGSPVGGTYVGNIQTDAGSYSASVKLKSGNNYRFVFREDPTTVEKLKALGLSFTAQSDETVLVSKTWYIAISNANQLLSGDNGGMFNIPGEWDYLDRSKIPSRPRLSKVPEQAASILKFTLTFTDPNSKEIVFGKAENDYKISILDYEKYVNESMPAGSYTMVFYIGNANDENGKPVMGDPSGVRFNFRVREIALTDTDRNAVSTVLKDYSPAYDGTKLNFQPTSGIALLDKLQPSRPQATPVSGSVWREHPEYYMPFSIKYRVVKVGEENPDLAYYAEEDYYAVGSKLVKPQAIGSYTIYYVLQAPNYSGEVEGSYKLNIVHYLNPVLPEFDYEDGTDHKVLNGVLSKLKEAGSDYYDIYTMLDYTKLADDDSLKRETHSAPDSMRNRYTYKGSLVDNYEEVGTHKIFLKIKSGCSAYVKWDKSIPADSIRTDYLVLSVVIKATNNREVRALSAREWEFNKFDESVNKPVWELKFDDDYTKYVFSLTLKSDATKKYFYFGNPELNATVPAGKTFNDAPAGEYTLTASAPENNEKGYDALTVSRDLIVRKSNIYFDKNPYVSGWSYGMMTKDTNVVPSYTLGSNIAAAIDDEIVVKFSKATDNATAVTSLAALADTHGNIPAGDYFLIFTRAEDDNYEELNYAVKFSVLKAQNYWDEVPAIQSWIYGMFESSNLPTEFHPHFGKDQSTILCEIRLVGEALFKFEEHPRYKDGQLGVGSYEMRIRVLPDTNGLKNFTGIETIIPFSVSKCENSWKVAPSVKSWTQGNYSAEENSPNAEAMFGNNTITYKVYDEKGNECDMSKLNSLAIGRYTLEAVIAGTDNYGELTTVVHFNVLEDSVGMTGIMVATICFSVVALGLAAAGITLLVLRSKRQEAEFRKTVKNELRRK